jgi:hypothetical protein
MTMTVDTAAARELALRHELNDLIAAQRGAAERAAQLEDLRTLPGSDPSLEDTARRWREEADRLGRDITSKRNALRRQQGLVERLRADAAGV